MENNDPNRRFDPAPASVLPMDWEDLKARFVAWREELMQSLQGKLATGEIDSDEFKAKADDVLKMVQERWKDLEQNYGEYARRFTSKIERHPVAATAIALGVGFLAGKLLPRR
ncbi:MAG TPA: DUF883 C-terminal domain-containing protein [Tepidisphaeraceae bacterium]|jgi:ElaB/YqjD/DUF883 family membrane-anchored ribosome-binding protein